MIEIKVLEYLKASLGIEVYLETQKDNNEKSYIILEKTSGGNENHIDKDTIAIQSYADSLYKAASLNKRVKEAMLKMPLYEDIGSCKLNSDYNFTDLTSKKYRYQAVFDIKY